MAAYAESGQAADLARREALTMSMLLERKAGNRFPDDDRTVWSTASGTITIVCPR